MKNLFFLFAAAAALTFTACSDDDNGGGAPPAQPTGSMTADYSSSTTPAEAWSLPTVTARMSAFNLTITGRDSDTGEILILNLPNNGEGIYFGESADFTSGSATYFANSNASAMKSSTFQDDSFIFVDITSIDSIGKILNGTFGVWVYAADTAGAPFVVLQNGNLVNVPYTGSSTDVNLGATSTFTATVDGESFTPDFLTIFDQFESVNVQGQTFDGEALFVTLPYELTSGTYELGFAANPDIPILAGFGAGLDPALASEGTITFTRDFVTQNITGTFSFTAESVNGPEFVITNGVINANY